MPPTPTGFGHIIDGVRKAITFQSIEDAVRHAPKGHKVEIFDKGIGKVVKVVKPRLID